MEKVQEFDRISNQFLLKSDSLCKWMEPFFFSMFLCICRGFLKYRMRVTLSKIILSILIQNVSKTLFSQQIQIDDGLLEGWSKWTPLILSTDTNSRGDDDSRYALLWFHTVRREPGMLQRYICCYHKQNRYTWNSAIIPISLPLLCICHNAFSLSWYSVVGQRWQIQALDGLAH